MKTPLQKSIPLSIAVLALFFSTHGASADFATVYRQAQNNDPTYAEARAKFDAVQEKRIQGRAGLLPSVVLSANSTFNRQDVDSAKLGPSKSEYNSNGYTLTLTQPLFRWQNWLSYEQSRLAVAQAEMTLAIARQDLILRTAQAYFETLQAQDNLKAAKALQTSLAGQLDIARKAFSVGTGIKTDIHDAEARYELASTQVMAAQTDLELRRRQLDSIAGPVQGFLAGRRSDVPMSPPDPIELEQWLDAADQGNFTVQQQRLGVEIASREVERQRSVHYPTLDLVASTGRNSTLNSGAQEVTTAERIGLQLNVPLFQGGEGVSKTNEAYANRRAATFALESARRNAAVTTRHAYWGVSNGLQQIRSLEKALKAARSAVASNQDAFRVGVRLNIDVLNAESQAYSTFRELTKTIVDTLLAQLKLKAAVGVLGDDDVSTLNNLLADNNPDVGLPPE